MCNYWLRRMWNFDIWCIIEYQFGKICFIWSFVVKDCSYLVGIQCFVLFGDYQCSDVIVDEIGQGLCF